MKVLKVPALVRDSVRPMCADTPLHTLSESLSELSLHICLLDLVECGVGVRVVSVPALPAQRHVQTCQNLDTADKLIKLPLSLQIQAKGGF